MWLAAHALPIAEAALNLATSVRQTSPHGQFGRGVGRASHVKEALVCPTTGQVPALGRTTWRLQAGCRWRSFNKFRPGLFLGRVNWN